MNGEKHAQHVNPDAAKVAGYLKPVYHGLYIQGVTSKILYDCLCDNEPYRIKAIVTRFCRPVYVGETLIVNMWKIGNRVIYESRTKERNKIAIKGYIELREP